MSIATTIVQLFIRIAGPIMIILGLLFWTGNALFLIPLHMTIGLLLVLALWTLAIIAAISRVNPGFVALVAIWSLILPALGLTQERLLPGAAHWLIQTLHLLVGIGAIALGEQLARRIKAVRLRAPSLTVPAQR
ncbi:MAG: hypothetical protein ACXWP6_10900 [Ktedonobacterales bacterium]